MDENLFEEELTIEALSAMGNPLEQLSALVDFEMFRPELEDILVKKDCKSTAGRPQFDVVLMFKVIFLQRYYGLGDKQIQYQIIDRTSFRQFLGIHTVDEIPDEKTVWHVKNILSKAGTFDALFDKSEASASSVPRHPRLSPVSYTTYSDMCKSTNTSRSLLPLWGSRVLTSNNQVK